MTTGTNYPAKDYLMPNHAYTVLEGLQLKNPNGSDGPKLIKIRNPHGSSRYHRRGPWGVKSTKWTADFKKQAKYTGIDTQGVFWFPLELFTSDFSGLTIAHWNDNYHTTNLQGDTNLFATSSKGYSNELLTIHNTEVQDVYVSCEKLLGRMFPYGLPTCKEEPANFYFGVYSKYSPYRG